MTGPPGSPGQAGCVCKLFRIILDDFFLIQPSGGEIVHQRICTATTQILPGPAHPIANAFCIPDQSLLFLWFFIEYLLKLNALWSKKKSMSYSERRYNFKSV